MVTTATFLPSLWEEIATFLLERRVVGEDKVQFSLAARITLSLEEDNEERISGEITAKGGDVEGGSVPRRRSREGGEDPWIGNSPI